MKATSLLLGCALLMSTVQVNATVHRVNNNVGSAAAFSTFAAAVASSSVLPGDTLHLEASATAYTPSLLNKRLVIIGLGYYLDPANGSTPGNAGLQASTNNARFSSALAFDTLATGSRFLGVEFTSVFLDPRADNISFERCLFTSSVSWNIVGTASQQAVGIRFNKCFLAASFSFSGSNFNFVDLEITNCIFTGGLSFSGANLLSALIRNNLFGSTVVVTNTYFANNIIINIGSGGFTSANSIVRNNISQFAGLFPAGNGNQAAPANDITRIILNTGTADGRFRLSPTSIAIGAGETVGGVTPDVGPFGTADPYRLSGIPPVPTIYSLTVPATVPAAATTMNITLSTRSNN